MKDQTISDKQMDQSPQIDTADELTLGQTLSRAADRQGLTAGDLASMLNLDVKLVKAVLEDRTSDAPPAVYVRAYLKSWAPALKLDIEQLNRRYARELGLHGESQQLRSRTRPTLAVMERERVKSRWFVWLFWLVVLAVAAVIVLRLLPDSLNGQMSETAGLNDLVMSGNGGGIAPIEVPPPPSLQSQSIQISMLPAIDEPVAVAESEPSQSEPPELVAVAESEPPQSETLEPVPVGEAAASTDQAAAESSSDRDAETDVPAVTPNLITLAAKGGESWVELTDADGNRLMFGSLASGQSREFEGRPPFTLVLGNPAVVIVTHAGQRVPVEPRANSGIARVTIGQ